jgi:hypothetical protein
MFKNDYGEWEKIAHKGGVEVADMNRWEGLP